MDNIIFNKIQNDGIFDKTFNDLVKNNSICFSSQGIIVVYAPNGTGKTSFINTLSDVETSEIKFWYKDIEYNKGQNIFSIILDQNDRNIIQGDTKDFYLGENIRKEFELEEKLRNCRSQVIEEIIEKVSSLNIKNKSSALLDYFDNDEKNFLSKAINNKNKLKDTSNKDIISFINNIPDMDEVKCDMSKLIFLMQDVSQNTNSLILLLQKLKDEELKQNENIIRYEENIDAINILKKYNNHNCIICDNKINPESLLEKKQKNEQEILKNLDENTKEILKEILKLRIQDDVFNIKDTVLNTIKCGNKALLEPLITDIENYKELYKKNLLREIKNIECFQEFKNLEKEYNDLIANQPIIENEDIEFIQQFINDCMDKKFEITRVKDKNYLQIQLEEQEILNIDRNKLPLSTGEQNFLSLFMEFLRVKNSTNPIVVIDDPVSSFDSIYKNKIIYSIVKVLEKKQVILLTHNIDVIRLLKSQVGKSFNLYILNNTKGSDNNGFIEVNNKELVLLTDLSSLTNFFRKDVFVEIQDVNLFLYSMIPFLRGYAHIIGNDNLYEQLTKLMHGYMNDNVDIADIYKKLFGDNSFTLESLSVNVDDILSIDLNSEILNIKNYPLLNKTLKHTLNYLYLRLFVEKELVNIFGIDSTNHNMLGSIINEAFPANENFEINKKRVFLTSKKTLINEFNHFEGNLSIFQPAIDITDSTLKKETKDIKDFIENLKKEAVDGTISNGN